ISIFRYVTSTLPPVHWARVAAERFTGGRPELHSSDPTQWPFNGYPKESHAPLHVAIARLVGYQWPRQNGSYIRDCFCSSARWTREVRRLRRNCNPEPRQGFYPPPLRQNLVYEGHFDKPKTKRSVRTIPIGKETAEILERVRPAFADPTALVFATREGLPLDRRNLLRKHVKPAAKKLGFTGVTWHLLRHSYATMLDGVGTPVGTMQSLLGHSAPEITREIYLHAIPEEQRRAVESVER